MTWRGGGRTLVCFRRDCAIDDDEIHALCLVAAAEKRRRKMIISRDYPAPIVDHALARKRALALFGAAAQ